MSEPTNASPDGMRSGELDLDAIEARAAAASPGPWHYGDVDSVAGGSLYDATRMIGDLHYEQPGDHDGRIVRHLLAPEADRNGEFIAHAREDVPALVAEVRRLRAAGDFRLGVSAVLMSLDVCRDEHERARVLATYREMVESADEPSPS